MQTRYPSSRGLVTDVLLSFAIYFVPLVMPHIIWPAGAYLLYSSARRAGSAGWLAMDWAAVLAAQSILFSILRVSRRQLRPAGRTLVAVVAFVAAVPALNVLLLWVIPLRQLAEASTAAEIDTLKEVCRVDGVALHPRVGTLHPQRPETAMVVRREAEYRPALLRIPGCKIQDLDIPADAAVANVSPSGGVLWRTREASEQGLGQYFVTTPAGTTAPTPVTVTGSYGPQLLDDGRTVAWIDQEPSPRLIVAADGSVRQIQGAGVPTATDGSLEGVGPDGPFHVLVIGRDTQWRTIDTQGQIIGSLRAPPEVAAHGHHLRPLANGWIAWDTYRDEGRYAITWNIDGRSGTRALPRGLAFTSLAFDDRGEHIALSATSRLNIGSQRDEVWVIRTSDGAEVFRRYAPKYARAAVALPAGRYFALDETRDGRPAVRVYQLGK